MPIYTKNGDNGDSSLIGGKKKPKFNEEFEVLGKIDELQAQLYSSLLHKPPQSNFLEVIVKDLHDVNSYIACAPKDSLASNLRARVDEMEERIDKMEEELPELSDFVKPKETRWSVEVNLTRVKVREVERILTRFFYEDSTEVEKTILVYFNRLSDYLFMLMLVD